MDRSEAKIRFDWRIMRFPFGVWAISHLIILIWAYVVISIFPVRVLTIVGSVPLPPAEGMSTLIEPWARWDTLWYLRLAERGYATTDLTGGFFPLYPLLIRGLMFIVPNSLFDALIISNLGALGAFSLFFLLARRLADETTARRALLYWVAFPTSFFFFAGYAEALMVFAALASVFSARQHQWLRAGIAAALATVTRPPGFLIGLPLAIEAILARGTTGESARRLIALLFIPLALGAFMLYSQVQFGDALFWLHAWNNVVIAPWDLAGKTLGAVLAGSAVENNLIDFCFTFLILGLTIIGIRSVPASFTAYAFAVILVQMLAYPPALGFVDIPMAAMARRVTIVFPAFLTLAQIWHGRFKEPMLLSVSFAMQLIFISIFVRGLWLD